MRNRVLAVAGALLPVAAALAEPSLVPDNVLFRGSQTVLPQLRDCFVQHLSPTHTRVTAATGTLIRILQARSGRPPQSHSFDMAPRIPERIFPFDSTNSGLVITTSIFVAAYNLLDCADPSMPAGCPADLNSDNAVDDADFVLFVNAYDTLICP